MVGTGGALGEPGIIGLAYQPGPGSYGEVANGSTLFGITGNAPRTISLWFNTPAFGNGTTPNQYRLIGVGSGAAGSFDIVAENTGTNNQVGLRYGNGNVFFNSDNSGTAFATNTWYQVTVVYDGSNLNLEGVGVPSNTTGLTFYVDGVEVNRAAGNGNNGSEALNTQANAPFYFGTAPDLVNDKYPGLLDDVQIYNTALTSSQVQSLYENPGSVIPEPASAGQCCLGGVMLLFRRRRTIF